MTIVALTTQIYSVSLGLIVQQMGMMRWQHPLHVNLQDSFWNFLVCVTSWTQLDIVKFLKSFVYYENFMWLIVMIKSIDLMFVGQKSFLVTYKLVCKYISLIFCWEPAQ